MLHQCVSAGAVSVIVIAAVWLLVMVIVFYKEKLTKQRWKIDAAKLEADHQKNRADRLEADHERDRERLSSRVSALEALNQRLKDSNRVKDQSLDGARAAHDATKRELDTLRSKLRAL